MRSFTDTEVNMPYLLCVASLAYHGPDIMTLYIGWNSRRKTHGWLKSSLYSKKSVSIPMDIANVVMAEKPEYSPQSQDCSSCNEKVWPAEPFPVCRTPSGRAGTISSPTKRNWRFWQAGPSAAKRIWRQPPVKCSPKVFEMSWSPWVATDVC